MASIGKRKGILHLQDTVRDLLLEYGDEVFDAVDDCCEAAARDACKRVRKNSKKRTGIYARDWSVMPSKFSRLGVVWIVYNKKHYRRAHLLENDHDFKTRTKSGEKITIGHWKGDHVIQEVDQYEQDWLYDEVVKRLGGAS